MAAAQAGDLPAAVQRVREAIKLQPRLGGDPAPPAPDVAPGAPAVCEALGLARDG